MRILYVKAYGGEGTDAPTWVHKRWENSIYCESSGVAASVEDWWQCVGILLCYGEGVEMMAEGSYRKGLWNNVMLM
jgi:hypothetical protein